MSQLTDLIHQSDKQTSKFFFEKKKNNFNVFFE